MANKKLETFLAVMIALCVSISAYGQDRGEVDDDGACCLPDGTCAVQSETDCETAGGAFSGRGSVCDDINCVGACCFLNDGDANCEALIEVDCDAAGGDFQGEGVDCNQIICRVDGACCLPDGTCVANQEESECTEDLGGIWRGFGSKCQDDVIEPYQANWAFFIEGCTGACCFDDGTCVNDQTLDECTAADGNFLGVDSECGEGDVCPVTDDDAVSMEVQCDFFDFVMINVPREFEFAKFDDEPAAENPRILERVQILVDGRVVLVAILDNRGNDGAVPILDNTSIFEQMTMGVTDNTGDDLDNAHAAGLPNLPVPIWGDAIGLFGGFPVGTDNPGGNPGDVFFLICPDEVGDPEEFIEPGQFCPFLSPYIFPGFCIANGCDAGDGDNSNLADNLTEARETFCFERNPDAVADGCVTAVLSDFVRVDETDETFLITLRGLGQLFSEGFGKGVLFRDPHRAVGKITVIYEFGFEIAACCLPEDVEGPTCQNLNRGDCEQLGGVWNQGQLCEDEGFECPGVCCRCDGTCEQAVASECLASNGDQFFGEGTSCEDVNCVIGACCLDDGCIEVTEFCCEEQGGLYAGDGTDCETTECPGACCRCDGTCEITVASDCLAENGDEFFGEGTTCNEINCVTGACCLDDGCVDVTEFCCDEMGGLYLGDGTDCATAECPGACCRCDGTCDITVESDCLIENGDVFFGEGSTCEEVECVTGACCVPPNTPGAQDLCIDGVTELCCEDILGGIYQGDGLTCNDVDCDEGACCLNDGSCIELSESECFDIGGEFQGSGVGCDEVDCPRPCAHNDKGSLLIFPKIELRWDAQGNLIQDTFLHLANDGNKDIHIQAVLVNGDPPLSATSTERAHPGWNLVDNAFVLTQNQPMYWSAWSGKPSDFFIDGTQVSLAPFALSLDPGSPPGRPDPFSANGERMMRGFLVLWAVNADNEQVRFNHLAGHATLINYQHGYAWEYLADTYGVCRDDIDNCEAFGTPGVLNLDGIDYSQAYSHLLMNFHASPGIAMSRLGLPVVTQTDLTLMPVDMDFRQNGDGPTTTKAVFNVWNENEVKFSGTRRCISCWDQTLLRDYSPPNPNNFLLPVLGTSIAKARIDGLASAECDFNPYGFGSSDAAMTGVVAKLMRVNGNLTAASGRRLHGMGSENAVIKYDALNAPIPEKSTLTPPRDEEEMERFIGRIRDVADTTTIRRSAGRGD